MTTADSPWSPIWPRPVSDAPSTASPRAVLVALGLGLAAAYVLPEGVPGLGLVLLGFCSAAALRWLHDSQVRGWQLTHAVVALALLTCLAWRDASWVLVFDLLMAFVAGSVALAPAATWAGVIRGAVIAGVVAPLSAGWLGRGAHRLVAGRRAPSHLARGVGLSALLLLVFTPLLSSADRHFSRLIDAVTPSLPDLGLLPVRTVVFVMASIGVAAGIRVLQAPPSELVLPAPRHALVRASEWLLPILLLTTLLGAFVVTQIVEIAHGKEHVLATAGLTYADYAHAGFFQLIAVTALLMVVVAAAVRWAPRAARPWLGGLVVLALCVDASALLRLHLYTQAYGLTRLRIAATTGALWLAVVIALVAAATLTNARWLPNAVVASVGGTLLALTAWNPDAHIASSQLQLASPDVSYLRSLSADAVDELAAARLPNSGCLLSDLRDGDGGPWTSFNLARHHAAVVARQRGC